MQSIPFYSNRIKDCPAVSESAWFETQATFKKTNPGQEISDFPFLITQWPGFETLLSVNSEDWVGVYEKTQEKLAKRLRKQGQPQNGVFYTPPTIAAYLVERTLGLFLTEQFNLIRQAVLAQKPEQAESILQRVQALKILDPACGTGVFLAQALTLLRNFYHRIQHEFPAFVLKGNAFSVVQNQLYGLDLDPLSVAITEFRLAQQVCLWGDFTWEDFKTYQPGHFLCADTLQKHSLSGQAWDFILGNPPYVSEVRKQAGRFQALQASEYYQAKMDLCDAFTGWSIDHLPPGSQLAYVLPEYWLHRASSAPVRDMFWTQGQFQEIWTFGEQVLFKNAPGHHTCLVVWQKQNRTPDIFGSQQAVLWGKPTNHSKLLHADDLKQSVILRNPQSGQYSLGNDLETALLARLCELPPLLGRQAIQQGIVLPQGRLKKTDWQRLPLELQKQLAPDSGIFLLSESESEVLNLNADEIALLKPYYGPRNFLPFQGFPSPLPLHQLVYTDSETRKRMAQNPIQYPALRAHLDRFAAILTSAFKPYGLHRPRQAHWFENPQKILCPRQVMQPAFAVVPHPAYVNEGFYLIQSEEDEWYLTAILNSQLAWFWFYHQKRKGHRLQIDKDVLIQFPQPALMPKSLRDSLIEIAKNLAQPQLVDPEKKQKLETLNRLVYQAYGLSNEETDLIRHAHHAIFGAG